MNPRALAYFSFYINYVSKRQYNSTFIRKKITYCFLQTIIYVRFLALLGALSLPAIALAQSENIASFDSIKGVVRVTETAGKTIFQFDQGGSFRLPKDWRQLTIEKATTLGNGSTALVVGYARANCSAQQALIVIEANRVLGPYNIGECEDSLAYQLTADRSSFVAVSTNSQPTQAWMYSTIDRLFRGPARITLSGNLAKLMAYQPIKDERVEQSHFQSPGFIEKSVVSKPNAFVNDNRAAEKLEPKVATRYPTKAEEVSMSDTLPIKEEISALSNPQQTRKSITKQKPQSLPAMGFSRNGMTSADASTITKQIRTSVKPQKQVTIDLSL